MAENSGSPVFADRYRFQPVRDDWDRGRSGLTHLVFDMKEERLGVIKRAETKSQQAMEGLKKEVGALVDLGGQGVPEMYDTGEAEYGSKNYFYMVIEYIEGLRVEKNLGILTALERAEILAQFFSLLAKAHQMGIVNGDVDLKHLFWNRDTRQVVVIDWGNARLDVDPMKKTEFAYDLARSAEIVYALTTRKGNPAATGPIALPNDTALFPGLAPVPVEFRNLCKWAPRAPADGAKSPHTALELFEVSKKWKDAIRGEQPYQPPSAPRPRRLVPTIVGLILASFVIFLTVFDGLKIIQSLFAPPAPTSTETIAASASPEVPPTTETAPPTETPAEVASATSTQPTELTPTPTVEPLPAVSPSPGVYANSILQFDENSPQTNCFLNETNSSFELKQEGFTRRGDRNWRFGINEGRTTDEFAHTDFSQCLDVTQVGAIALNVWMTRLELQRDLPDNPGVVEPGKEFGFFIEYAGGQRREYTLWIDKEETMRLRVREDAEITFDDIVLIVNQRDLKILGNFPRKYSEFPIQIFFERDNNGLDIIYLRQGPEDAVSAEDLDPSLMTRIDSAVRPTLDGIQRIGLIGYGGETRTLIWPLVFFGR